jgi:hypothetical protein
MSKADRRLVMILATTFSLAGCRDTGVEPTPEHPLFQRYVAVGNSITAGFESEGINDSTQENAYSVQFAARFGAPYAFAGVRRPGCPAPLMGPLAITTERVGGARATDCAGLRSRLPSVNHNLGVPGIRMADASRAPAETAFAPYNLFIRLLFREVFGGRTLVQAMENANPTLVSVWLGNNDALTAVTGGDLAHLTPAAAFAESLDQIVAAIAGLPRLEDAILIGVGNPLLIPLVQPGLYYWMLAQDPQTAVLLRDKPVSEDCAPGTPGSENLVSARVLRSPVLEISCGDDAPFVTTAADQAVIVARIGEYNDAIRSRAAANGWIYIDVVATQLEQRGDQTGMRLCQGLLAATTHQERVQALHEGCPLPRDDPRDFFGRFFSFDGFHPSREGQRVIADRMETAVRTKHGI